jgi:hypothetical protein
VSTRNPALTYRPLQGGILIINPANARPGTLGIILAAGADCFALSCYHVLGRADNSGFVEGEPILQSLPAKGGSQVARIFAANCDVALDIAAAKLDPGVESTRKILGISVVGQMVPPAMGMRVLKSGAATGVTEGRVVRVDNDRVEISRPAGYPPVYELCDFGDSGAVWVEADTTRPLAMHDAQAPNGNAIGVRFDVVLARLGMALLP